MDLRLWRRGVGIVCEVSDGGLEGEGEGGFGIHGSELMGGGLHTFQGIYLIDCSWV